MTAFDVPVATYNLGSGAFRDKVADLAKLAEHSALMMLAECGDRRNEIQRFLRDHPEWRGYSGDGTPGASHTPILWWTGVLTLRQSSTSEAVPSRFVGPKGAGPSRMGRKVNNRVRLGHVATGRPLLAYSVHALPSATRRNLPVSERRLRLAHYQQHMTSLVTDIRRRRGLVVVAGDFNAPPRFPGLEPLREAGLVCDTTEATHHGVAIDQVWHREDEGIRSAARFTLEMSSDHKAMVEVLQIIA